MTSEKPSKKILITHCGKLTTSETFILAHLDELPFQVGFAEGAPPKLLSREEILPGEPTVFTGDRDWTPECRTILETAKPDLVLAEYGPTGVMWCRACEQADIPLVVFFHGFDAGLTKVLEKFGEGYRTLFSYAKAVVAPSKALLRQLAPWLPPHLPTAVNPYGVNLTSFSYHPPKIEDSLTHLLYVGRFVEKKAPQLALQAAVPFLQRQESRTLTMIGKGPLLAECQQIAISEGVAEQVNFPASTLHVDVPVAMASADLLILPSQVASSGDREGLPVVLLEAAASGLPILSTRHSGIPEFVEHEESGLLVEEGDLQGLVGAVERFSENPDLRLRCAKNARQKIEEWYQQKHHMKRLGDLLGGILGSN